MIQNMLLFGLLSQKKKKNDYSMGLTIFHRIFFDISTSGLDVRIVK